MSIGTFLIAFFSTVSIDKDYSQWDEGYFAVLGSKVIKAKETRFIYQFFSSQLGGKAFQSFVVIGSLISCLGCYNVLLYSTAQCISFLFFVICLISHFKSFIIKKSFESSWKT